MNLFIFLLLIHFSHQQEDNAKILCSEAFCKDQIKKNPCPELSESCKIQNATYNGLLLPYPEPCNCCTYCVENLGLGEECITGSPDGALPDVICGDGLFCDEITSRCIANPTPCINDQQTFQEKKKKGTLGFLEERPQCDKRGRYLQVKCIPGEICFCVDKDGSRIFGEFPHNIQALDITKCGCSRSINNINKILKEENYSSKRPKCLADGNYDTIQCVNKNCICADKFNGSPTDSKIAPVNIHLAPDMPCFDNSSHPEGVYLNACEKEYIRILEKIDYKNEIGFDYVIGYKFPACQLDGRYAAVQETETHKFCADPDRNQLESFIITKTDVLAETMNCHCARSRSIIPWLEKPECCENGNYKRMQCRRGKCYCVDKNGLQIEKEVTYINREKLSCYKNCTSCKELCTE